MSNSKLQADGSIDVDQDLLSKLKASPGSVPELWQLGALYEERGQYEQQAAVLRKLLARELPPDQQAEAMFQLACALNRQFQFNEAIAHAEKLVDQFPNYPRLSSVLSTLGALYVTRSTWQGNAEAALRDATAAESYLRRALDRLDGPQDRAVALLELGAALRTEGRLEESKVALHQALDHGVKDTLIAARCYEELGRTSLWMGQAEQARAYYEQSALTWPPEPNNARAALYVSLARLYEQVGDTQQAERACEDAWQALDRSIPKTAIRVIGHIREVLGDICYDKGKYEQAAKHYQAALEQDRMEDEQQALYHALGLALAASAQYEHAMTSLRQALAIATSSQPRDQSFVGELLWEMGQVAYRLGDYDQAVELLEKAVGLVSLLSLAKVHLWLGHSYFSVKQYNKAITAYERVLTETDRKSPHRKEAQKYLAAADRLWRSKR